MSAMSDLDVRLQELVERYYNSLEDQLYDPDPEVDGYVLSLIKSYRAMSHKVVPVRLLASVISRHADGEKGKAS